MKAAASVAVARDQEQATATAGATATATALAGRIAWSLDYDQTGISRLGFLTQPGAFHLVWLCLPIPT